MTIVKNQGQDAPDACNTFVGVLRNLEQNLAQYHKTPEVKAILAEGLKIARKTDDEYQQNCDFPRIRAYQLYTVAVKLWSYQHELLLDSFEIARNSSPQYNLLIDEHEQLLYIFNDFKNNIFAIENINLEDIFQVWISTIQILAEQFEKFSDHRFAKGRRRLSANAVYAIIATVCFGVGLLIATLLLI